MSKTNNNWKTPLGYYEMAIAELRQAREELQEYQSICGFNIENLQTEIKELKFELQTTQTRLETAENTATVVQINLVDAKNELEALKEIMNYEPQANSQILAELAQIKEQISQIQQPDLPTPVILQSLSDLQLQISQLAAELTLVSHTYGIDYRNLQKLLGESKWQEADKETYSTMLKICECEEQGWLDDGRIKQFPRHDLHIINNLWVQYSEGKFGFSIQQRISQSKKDYKHFAYKLGWIGNLANSEWIKYEDYNFTLDAPKGHLPSTSKLLGLGLRNPNELLHRLKIFYSRY
jgi:chromosome segregation ATPase